MRPDWKKARKPSDLNIPKSHLEKDLETQERRNLTFLYQEAAFLERIPLYGVLDLEDIDEPDDKQFLLNIFPSAKAAIIIGIPINDPWMRVWHLVPGTTMKKAATAAASKVEIYLRTFAEKLEIQGYEAEILQAPLTPDPQIARLFSYAKIGFVGKNNMISTEINGCRVNLGFILTDAPLLGGDYRYDTYEKNKCGECSLCEKSCPAGALNDSKFCKEECDS
jgi:epoxyqueuosine reductase QueG